VRDNNEGNSGGPFYRSLLNQATSTTQEITYIINYGEAQTEPFRPGTLNTYTLVFNNGSAPAALDTSFFASMGMSGFVGPEQRGRVAGVGLAGRDTRYEYTVGFSNATAQYWAKADAATGHFDSPGMIPGAYTMNVYKNELVVDTRTVTVAAGQTLALNTIAIGGDPSAAAALWRIGDWDGSPAELLNGDKVTTMHPSDVRMASWTPGDYVVGLSNPATGFPAYQWKDVNGTLTIRFNLRQSQIAPLTLRAGITVAYSGGRPKAQVNGWISANPAASTQPKTRTLTVGTYRGNNTMYTFNIPASELVVGENVLTLTAISGTAGTAFLSPGYAWDAIDLIPTP
jgi:rhamnogalacturonan endolyase